MDASKQITPEILADMTHTLWSTHVVEFCSLLVKQEDNSGFIPAEVIASMLALAETPYFNLPEPVKQVRRDVANLTFSPFVLSIREVLKEKGELTNLQVQTIAFTISSYARCPVCNSGQLIQHKSLLLAKDLFIGCDNKKCGFAENVLMKEFGNQHELTLHLVRRAIFKIGVELAKEAKEEDNANN